MLIATTVAALVVVGIAIALFLSGGDDEVQTGSDKKVGKNIQKNGPSKKHGPKAAKKKKQRQRAKMKEKLGLRWTVDSDGLWEGYVPARGWRGPESLGNQSEDEGMPRYRTLVDGSRGDFLLVDTTPTIDPTEDPANFTIGDAEVSPKSIPTPMSTSYIMLSKRGTDECEGIVCVRVLMSDGDGGGIAFYAGSPNSMRAKLIATEFAGAIKPRY